MPDEPHFIRARPFFVGAFVAEVTGALIVGFIDPSRGWYGVFVGAGVFVTLVCLIRATK